MKTSHTATPTDDDRDTMVRIRMSLHTRAKDLAWRDRLEVREWYDRVVRNAIELAETESAAPGARDRGARHTPPP